MKQIAFAALVLFAAACSGAGRDDDAGEADPDLAVTIAHETIIVDGHIDLPWRLYGPMSKAQRESLELPEDVSQRTETGDFDFPRAREGGLDAPFMSIYVPARYEGTGQAKAVADRLIDVVESIARNHPGKFALATTESDIRDNHAAGRISLLLGMENGSPIEEDLQNLRHFFDRGVRYVTLAHSKDNHICDSSYDESRTWGGLSPFGREVVSEMNHLGMMVDISHLSDDAANDVLDVTRAPVIASHSSCRHFTPGFERNIDDALLRRVKENGGVVMINFGSTFLLGELREASTANRKHVSDYIEHEGLEPESEEARAYRKRYFAENHPGYAELSDVVDHIDHVVEVAGIDHVGLGSDFDGVGDSLPTGLKDASDYPNLIAALLERGYTRAEIEKICSGNVFRVMRDVARAAARDAGAP